MLLRELPLNLPEKIVSSVEERETFYQRRSSVFPLIIDTIRGVIILGGTIKRGGQLFQILLRGSVLKLTSFQCRMKLEVT